MSIFDNIEPYFADRRVRERFHTLKEDAAIAGELQAIRERIHALKVRKRQNEQLKDKLAEESERDWQEEAQLSAAAE